MRFSLRQRLIALTLLGTLAFIAALVTIVRLAATGQEQRIERARESVEREVERMRTREQEDDDPFFRPDRVRPSREGPPMRTGYLDPMRPPPGPSSRFDRFGGPMLHEALASLRAEVDAHDGIATRTTPARDGTLVIALGRTVSGRYAWAAQRVPEQSQLGAWRLGLLVLAVATLLLVVATLQTLFAFRRGAGSLQGSLESLTRSLDAPVARPDIRELGDVADGIARLARALSHAQAERERLTRELVERERLASLGRVAAGVAHEVRNPLASMKLRVDLAERVPGVPTSVAQDLAEVSGEIQRLDRLVTDLLALTGRRLGRRATTDLLAFTQKRVDLLAPWMDENGVKVLVEGTGEADIDVDALGRAIDNLLRNAVQFSPRDAAVRVVIESRGDDASLTVVDHGPGVPADQVSKLFEPFFTTRAEGTGLGLALSRSIAHAHGGTLEYARHGDETRFVITIPRHAPASANGSTNA